MHAQQMLYYSLYVYEVQSSDLFIITIPWTLAITLINLASLQQLKIVTRNSHTSLCTLAIVLKQEQMVIIISISNFLQYYQ